jgi:CHASE1-domain containing sensor protein
MSKSPQPRTIFSLIRKYIPLIFTLIGGAAVSVTGFFLLFNTERARLKADFESMATDRAQAIRAGISEDTIEIGLFSAYFGAANELAKNSLDTLSTEFERLYGGISDREVDNVAICLATRVPDEGRGSFETVTKLQLKLDGGIMDLDSYGAAVPAKKRDEYFPITVVEPPELRTRLLGLDLLSISDLKTSIDAAIKTGKRAATGKVEQPALQGDKYPRKNKFTFPACSRAPERGCSSTSAVRDGDVDGPQTSARRMS